MAGLAAAAALPLAGCAGFERKLAAILADPMSGWVPPGMVSEERTESPAGTGGGIAGGSASASLTRFLLLLDPSSADSAWKAAAAAATSNGWAPETLEYPRIDVFTKNLGNFGGTLSFSSSPRSNSGLVVVITNG
jgi:hypothetical protein